MTAPNANYSLPTISDGVDWMHRLILGQLPARPTRPTAETDHTAVWTGSEMIVWGGVHCVCRVMNTGGRYNPSTDSWTATSTTNAPAADEYITRQCGPAVK